MKQIITYDNKTFDLTDQQYENLVELSTNGRSDGIWVEGKYIGFKNIKEIGEAAVQDYHQPYALPAKGFDGIIRSATKTSHLEALGNGLNKFLAKNPKSDKANELLKVVRKKYLKIKKNVIPVS